MKLPALMGSVCLILTGGVQAVPPPAATAEWNAFLSTCGVFFTVAGNGGNVVNLDDNDWQIALAGGTNYENGLAISCNLSNPHMAGADALGNIYIADKASHSILKVTPDGLIHTLAGTHASGNGTDVLALGTTVALDQPNGLYVLPDGTVFVYDAGNHRIRKITPAGMISTVINDGDIRWLSSGRGLWVNQAQTVIYYTMEVSNFAGGSFGGVVKKWTPTAGIKVITAYPVSPSSSNLEFRNPGNIDVNPVNGKLYVTDRAEDDATPLRSKVWRIDTEGVNGSASTKVAVAGSGVSTIPGGDGELATATFLDQVRGISFLPNGAYFLVTHEGGDVWYVDTFGYIHLFIQGKGSKDAHKAEGATAFPIVGDDYISEPRSVVVAPNGGLLIVCNDSGYVRRVSRNAAPAPPSVQDATFTNATTWRIRWPSVVGRTYLVERNLNLQGAWEVRQIVTATAAQSTFLETTPSGSSRCFYRISPPR